MDALQYATELIAFPSVSTTSNEAISRCVANHLQRLQFEVEWLTYRDASGVTKVNVIGKRGTGRGGVAYLAHTDVVPADDWNVEFCGPFHPTVRDGRLWGRGSCDMKGSLACALAAIERISPSEQKGPLFVVCTADEELGTVGARQVDEQSQFFSEMVHNRTFGIVGEPTCLEVIYAHKGGVGLTITSRGVSAHSSLSTGINANHGLIPILPELLEIYRECQSNPDLQSHDFDPPGLSWNMILKNVPEAINVTPSLAQACIFFRPMPGVDHQPLIARVQAAAERNGLEFQFVDRTPPFRIEPDQPCVRFMLEQTQHSVPRTVCYATDGGVLRRLQQMVVCGPGDIAQAHRNDEWIALEQLDLGTDLYERVFRNWDTWKGSSDSKSVLESSTFEARDQASERTVPEMVIRQATQEDLARVQAFLQIFVNQNKLLKRSRAEIATLLSNGFLAEIGDNIIGFCAIEIYSRKLGEIQCLAVSEHHQGRGIGSALVQRCVERGKEKGILEVMAISSSDGFLRKLGFDYSLPNQKRALFCQLRSRDEMFPNAPSDE